MIRRLLLMTVLLLLALSATAQAACTGPAAAEGGITYNNGYHTFQYCNGTAWMSFGGIDPAAGGGGCTSPTGNERDMIYSNSYHVYQYCDGTNWMQVGGYAACAGAGSRTPAQIFGTNLVAWYDASDASTITQSSGAVSQWNDKSGNGYNLTQSTSGYRPIYSATGSVNGKPAITFDGSDDYLSVAGVSGFGPGIAGAFTVASMTTQGSNERLVSLADSTQPNDFQYSTSAAMLYARTVGGYRNGTAVTGPTTMALGTQYRLSSVLTGSQLIITVNAVSPPASSVSSSGALASNMEIWIGNGKASVTSSWNGKVSEVVITKVAPTLQQQLDLDDYFQLRW